MSQGPLLLRVTGVSPSGIPFINVLTVAQSILASLALPQGAAPSGPTATEPAPTAARGIGIPLPATPAVRLRRVFPVFTRGTYTSAEVVAALQHVD